MAILIVRDDEGYLLQGARFTSKIDNYTVTLGLLTADVDQVKLDFAWFGYSFGGMKLFRDYSQALTAFKSQLRHGFNGQPLPAFPSIPALDAAPTPAITVGDAQARFERLVQQIVKSKNYSKTIGEDLGIEAPETPFNPADGKPELKPTYSTGGHPELKWKKGKFQGIEIWIDRGDGKGWLYLDKDMHPDFTDKISTLPAAGASTIWKYKAIYLYKAVFNQFKKGGFIKPPFSF
jgi:hypothetical protein